MTPDSNRFPKYHHRSAAHMMMREAPVRWAEAYGATGPMQRRPPVASSEIAITLEYSRRRGKYILHRSNGHNR